MNQSSQLCEVSRKIGNITPAGVVYVLDFRENDFEVTYTLFREDQHSDTDIRRSRKWLREQNKYGKFRIAAIYVFRIKIEKKE